MLTFERNGVNFQEAGAETIDKYPHTNLDGFVFELILFTKIIIRLIMTVVSKYSLTFVFTPRHFLPKIPARPLCFYKLNNSRSSWENLLSMKIIP